MRTLLFNGKIYLERERFAEALLIEDGTIKSVGSNLELSTLKVDERIDCQGKTVIPGINDSHMHLVAVGEGLETVNLQGSSSIDEIVERCRKFISENSELAKNGILAMGWNQDLFLDEKRIPNRHDADRISTDIPILLRRVCGHVLIGNTKAIEMVGIDGNTPQFEGGTFEIGEDGFPNGVFTENACGKLRRALKDYTLKDRERMFIKAMEHAVSFGITSVQSNDIGAVITREKEEALEMFKNVFAEGKAKLRYHHQICFKTPQELKEWIDKGYFKDDENLWHTVGQLKLFKDGSLGARTALMENEYADAPGVYGEERFSDEQVDEFCKVADEHGIQIITHVIGDRAINKVVKSYEKVIKNGENPNRHGLVHCQITTKEMLERIAKDNLVVFYQPIFLDYDIHIVEDRCGKELAKTSYAFKSLEELGSKVCYGTDSPVEPCNPFPNIYCAVTRKDLKGNPKSGFVPEECVDIYTAIDNYTYGGAYAQFMENKKGRVKEGYLADLAILDRDIFTVAPEEIKDIKVEMTIVNGEIVYKR